MRLSIHAVGVRLLTRFVPAPAKRFSVSSRLAGASYALVLFDSSSSSSSSIAAGVECLSDVKESKFSNFPRWGVGTAVLEYPCWAHATQRMQDLRCSAESGLRPLRAILLINTSSSTL